MKTRTIFERWLRSFIKDQKPVLTKNKDGSYVDKTVNDHWIGFQAAAMLME